MERCDADQELPSRPPQNTTRLIARDEANQAILSHLSLCPLARENVTARLTALEISYGRLIGFLLGSGILGGLAGGVVSKLIK